MKLMINKLGGKQKFHYEKTTFNLQFSQKNSFGVLPSTPSFFQPNLIQNSRYFPQYQKNFISSKSRTLTEPQTSSILHFERYFKQTNKKIQLNESDFQLRSFFQQISLLFHSSTPIIHSNFSHSQIIDDKTEKFILLFQTAKNISK